jgi:hypothetical protein
MPIVVILLVVLLFMSTSSGGVLEAAAGSAPPDGGAPPPPTTSGGIPLSEPGCGGIGGFIESHVQRKDAFAPLVAQKYGVPGAIAGPLTKVADKLDASGYVENAIDSKLGSKLCNVSPLGAAAAGAKFLGKEIVAGGKAAYNFTKSTITNPASTAATGVAKLNSAATKVVGGAAALTDRGTNALYSKLPAPLKLGAAPAVAVEKVTASAVKKANALANKTTGALVSGAKTAEHAVSSGVNKVLGWL